MKSDSQKGDKRVIKCPRCSYECDYEGPICPKCKARYSFTSAQIEEKLDEIADAQASRNYDLYVEGCHILADMGHTPSEREYASILEEGELVSRNYDLAMKYFARAAEKNDAYSAFRYSRLVERTNGRVSRFWLRFATVLGSPDSFPALAARLSAEGKNREANYYYALAASLDDADSIVTLAKRYYNGVGAEENPSYAKWYMDKLTLPPIHAIKLAYQLRRTEAVEPPEPVHPNYTEMLRDLAKEASEFGYSRPFHKLCSLLSDRGDTEARVTLGMLYLEGIGTARDTARAIEFLTDAASHGYPLAYKYLGDIYLSGTNTAPNAEKAVFYYRRAAEGGMTNAYETMGDIYAEGRLVPKNIKEAIRLYDMAGAEGHASGTAKANALRRRREQLYNDARSAESLGKVKEAFRDYSISTVMGYTPAICELARCYELGIGTRKDRHAAYVRYKEADAAGDAFGTYKLGLCYSRGIGTRFEFDKAKEALTRAAKSGIKKALEELARIYENKKRHMVRKAYSTAMRLIYRKNFAAAREHLAISVRADDARGIYTLGCLCEFGLGAPTDRERAFSLYERAFDLKFRDPRAVYKIIILKMARRS